MGKLIHPCFSCATPFCCCCCYFGPKKTCILIAYIIIVHSFSGFTNIGVGYWALYILAIPNMLLHIAAGVVLYLGALWERDYFKVIYCWMTVPGILITIGSLVLYIYFGDQSFIYGGKHCEPGSERMFPWVILNTIWLVIIDFYTPMIVLGSLTGTEDSCTSVTEADLGPHIDPVRVENRSTVWQFSMEEYEILNLSTQEKWEEILDNFGKNKFLPWIWPEKRNLEFIERSVRSQNLKSVISIGCGSGLLEWLLVAATGMEVTGIETDGNWWKSKYSSGTFIPMILVDDSKKGEFGLETANSALLFCYFNNLEAFLNYINNFKGDCFIVIGPGQGRGTYTVPQPFDLPGGLEENWKLSDHQEIRSSKDFIAVYVRK